MASVTMTIEEELLEQDDDLLEHLELMEMFTELTPEQGVLPLVLSPNCKKQQQQKDRLTSTVDALAESKPLCMEAAFELLRAVQREDPVVVDRLPIRSTASPLLPGSCMTYVVRRGAKGASGAKDTEHSDASSTSSNSGHESITVSFQSIVNSDVWWSPSFRGEGVASRPMSRTRRERGADRKSEHGYRGRMYTLIQRAPGEEGELPCKRRRQSHGVKQDPEKQAKFVAAGDSVVHAWRHVDEGDADDVPAKTVETGCARSGKRSSLCSTDEKHEEEEEREVVGAATRFDGNVTIEGDLKVSGVVYGQLSSKPRCADYAEWFMFDDDAVSADVLAAKYPKGSVVQLRSPEQRLTLDTSGDGPCLIISTSPSVAAGVPEGDAAESGALVAFLGQVPVRCRGRILVGDQLVPSMRNDGCAVALREYLVTQRAAQRRAADPKTLALPIEDCIPDALGVAMEAGEPPEGDEEILLCFVRWNHAVRRELKEQLDKVGAKATSRWMRLLINTITTIAAVLILLECISLVFTFFHPDGVRPRSPARGAIIVFALLNFALVVTLFVAFSPVSSNGGKVLFFFWFGFVFLVIILVAAWGTSYGVTMLLYVVWTCYNIAYNATVMAVMADLRGGILCSRLETCFCLPFASRVRLNAAGEKEQQPIETNNNLPPV